MKIQLPNGERITLPGDLQIKDKIELVQEMVTEWDELICKNWESDTIVFFLDGLANYLVWHKEEEKKNKQDKYIFSIKKVEQMSGKRKALSIPFSSLPKQEKELLGLEEYKDA